MHKVLIVEDDGAAREGLGQLLAGSGFSVTTASDGIEALERLSRQEFDLMLLDIWMPRMDGLQLLAHLGDEVNPLNVIVMTADASPETLLLTMRKRAYQFLSKPIHPATLLERLCSTLAPAPNPAVVVLSARADWVEVLAPCVPEVADRIHHDMLQLELDLPQDDRETIGHVFRELMLDAMGWPGQRDPGRQVRMACLRTGKMLLYRIVDAARVVNAGASLLDAFPSSGVEGSGRNLTERSTALMAWTGGDEVLFNEDEVVVVKYLG